MHHHRWLAALWAAVTLAPLAAASAAETIKIGFPMPLSGPTAVYGVPVTKGAELAVAEINAKGGVLGRKLENRCRATARPMPTRRCASLASWSSRTMSISWPAR